MLMDYLFKIFNVKNNYDIISIHEYGIPKYHQCVL